MSGAQNVTNAILLKMSMCSMKHRCFLEFLYLGWETNEFFSELCDSIESFPKHDRLMKAEAAVSAEGTA